MKNQELIDKINRCNLDKNVKKELINLATEKNWSAFVKRLFMICSIGKNLLDAFDLEELEEVKKLFE